MYYNYQLPMLAHLRSEELLREASQNRLIKMVTQAKTMRKQTQNMRITGGNTQVAHVSR